MMHASFPGSSWVWTLAVVAFALTVLEYDACFLTRWLLVLTGVVLSLKVHVDCGGSLIDGSLIERRWLMILALLGGFVVTVALVPVGAGCLVLCPTLPFFAVLVRVL